MMFVIRSLHSRLIFITCLTARRMSTEKSLIPSLALAPKLLVQEPKISEKGRKISKAMTLYMEASKKSQEFFEELNEEFELGKRHLANIMGVDADEMTQQDIDLAIQYLMPSALFSLRSRPLMRPPSELFPKQRAVQFDIDGRPFHTLFYTSLPNFYGSCYEASQYLVELDNFEDRMIQKGVLEAPQEAKIDLRTSTWLSLEEMTNLLFENIYDMHYDFFIKVMERLCQHPYSMRCKDFIMKYRKELVKVTAQMEIPPLQYDEDGRPYSVANGTRKHCYATVCVKGNGTGIFDVNGQDILYFRDIQHREQCMTPLNFCDLLFKVDVYCQVEGPGSVSQSGAIRLALSNALKSFLDVSTVEKMRLAGLLTYDLRRKERNKPNKKKARRGYTWKKR